VRKYCLALLAVLVVCLTNCTDSTKPLVNVDVTGWQVHFVDSSSTGSNTILLPPNYYVPQKGEALFWAGKTSMEQYPPILVINKTIEEQKLHTKLVKDIVVRDFPEFSITNISNEGAAFVGDCFAKIDSYKTKGYYACYQHPSSLVLYHLIILSQIEGKADSYEQDKDTMLTIVRSLKFGYVYKVGN